MSSASAETTMTECPSDKCEFISMLHVPVNTILTAPLSWREDLPAATAKDWRRFDALEEKYSNFLRPGPDGFFQHADDARLFEALEEQAKDFSFISFLLDQALREAELYCRYGADMLMLENIAAPYFVRERQPVAIVAIMSFLARNLQAAHPDKPLGLQILAFSDDLALAIALRHGFRFVRSESALFAGLRPEGPTPNQGNLAALYTMRNRWLARYPDADVPRVFVDLRKKHTLFPPGLVELDFWMENLLFQKIEGVILTGPATGKAVDRDELHRLRRAIDELHSGSTPPAWKPQLLIGSGVSLDNLALCRHYADGVIVGSSLKENGYWECPLDKWRLQTFMEKWHTSS